MITKCNVHVSKEDDLQDEMKKLLECHKKIALEFIESIKSNDNIIAVMGLGSLARNYADNISDIDLGIIFTGDKLPVSRGETLFKENVIDKVVLHIYGGHRVVEVLQRIMDERSLFICYYIILNR